MRKSECEVNGGFELHLVLHGPVGATNQSCRESVLRRTPSARPRMAVADHASDIYSWGSLAGGALRLGHEELRCAQRSGAEGEAR